MKLTKITGLIVLLFFVLANVTFLAAQEEQAAQPTEKTDASKTVKKDSRLPEDQWGLGVEAGSSGIMSESSPNFGINGVFAINKDYHLGANIGFYVDGGSGKTMNSFFMFAPYIKYFMMNIKNFNVFAKAQFSLLTTPRKVVSNFGGEEFTAKTNTAFALGGGAEWFPYRSVGVYGGINIIQVNFDPTRVLGGLANTYVGIEWFF